MFSGVHLTSFPDEPGSILSVSLSCSVSVILFRVFRGSKPLDVRVAFEIESGTEPRNTRNKMTNTGREKDSEQEKDTEQEEQNEQEK